MAIENEETKDCADDDLDEDDEVIEGEIVDMRGPFPDGSAEIDVKKADGEVITVTMTAGQVAELLGEEPPKAN